MDKLIELFLKTAKPLHKFGIVLAFLIILVLIDQFTSYPSLSFERDKYETIEILTRITRDSIYSTTTREMAAQRLHDLETRVSFRETLQIIGQKSSSLDIRRRVSKFPIIMEGKGFIPFIIYSLKVLLWVCASAGLFIGVAITATIDKFKEERKWWIWAIWLPVYLIGAAYLPLYISAYGAPSTSGYSPFLFGLVVQTVFLVIWASIATVVVLLEKLYDLIKSRVAKAIKSRE